MQGLFPDNVTTLGVSEAANNALLDICPQWKISGTLPFGIEDYCAGWIRKNQDRDKLTFLTVGTIEPRKGQDVLCKAVALLTDEERSKCEFLIVGGEGQDIPAAYMAEIRNFIGQYPQIKRIGSMPHEQVLELYKRVDVVIIPSREEILPFIAIEAMAASMPCILSDGVGASILKQDEKNSLVFPMADSSVLAEKIRWLLTHKDEAAKIGKFGRSVYDENFTTQMFKERLINTIDKIV